LLFNHLVRPVLSYGCQVWGANYLEVPPATPIEPAAGGSACWRGIVPDNALERVQTDFLRFVMGVGRVTPNWILLQELGVDPLQVHWATSVLRFWNEVRDKPSCMAAHAARADLYMMCQGRTKCWSWRVCTFLARLGLVPDARHAAPLLSPPGTPPNVPVIFPPDARDYFWSLRINVDSATQQLRARWRDRILLYAAQHPDPRTCLLLPRFVTYVHWVGVQECGKPAPHAALHTLAPTKHTCLMRFRVGGWHHLAVNHGRIQSGPARPARTQRVCTRCGGHHLEDELHVALECPSYAAVRHRYPSLFPPIPAAVPDTAALMRTLLAHPDQVALANYLHELYELTLY
jgi:hypothetical protein